MFNRRLSARQCQIKRVSWQKLLNKRNWRPNKLR